MSLAIQTAPDEQTPLLGGKNVSATQGVISVDPDPETATLAGSSNQSSRAPSIASKADVSDRVIKKTPLPWAQFSIILFLQLAEPLTSQVIYPVSSTAPKSLTERSTFNDPVFPSLHLRSVRALLIHLQNQQINPGRLFHQADTKFERCKERCGSRLLCWNHSKPLTNPGMVMALKMRDLASSNPYSLPPKHALSFIGAGSRTISAENR